MKEVLNEIDQDCVVNPILSRVCEYGTASCGVHHGTPTIAGLYKRLDAANVRLRALQEPPELQDGKVGRG